MSIVWFYFIVNEFVVVLVVLGVLLEIDVVIFGLIVLVWGNLIGDFMLNIVFFFNGNDGV